MQATRGVPARPLSALWHRVGPSTLGLSLFVFLSFQPASHLSLFHGRPLAFPAWLATVGVAFLVRRHPWAVAAAIIAASVVMRLNYIGLGFSDQITVSQSAWERVMTGGNPYGLGYATTYPPGSPFPYGPLALVWWLGGPIVEFVAAIALMALLAWRRAWMTLAVMAGWAPMVYLTFTGTNDYSPGLLIALAVVLLRTRPRWAGAVMALAAALKPYAAAWFLPFIGFGGVAVAVPLVGMSVVLWSPMLLLWGVPSYLRSVELAGQVHTRMDPNGLGVPYLRWLAIPLAALGLAARRWEHAVFLGGATSIVFLFLEHWVSWGYWVAVIPSLGLAAESLVSEPHPDPPLSVEDSGALVSDLVASGVPLSEPVGADLAQTTRPGQAT